MQKKGFGRHVTYRLYRLRIHSVSISCTHFMCALLSQSCSEIQMNECLYLLSADFSYMRDTAGEGKLCTLFLQP